MDLDHRVIVITGASGGIGSVLAELASRHGATVVLVGRRADALRAVSDRCHGRGHVTVADVTSLDDVRRVVDDTIARFKGIDVWVNNAGQGISRMPSALTSDDIDDMMRVNVKSVLYGMQATLPHFKARGTGHVINISSMLGRIPMATFRSAYCGAKHFVNALTQTFRDEVHATHPGIQYSLVSPGVVYTDFGLNARHGVEDSRAIPGGQTPEVVAEAIITVIRTRQPDVYTRTGSHARVAEYYSALGQDVG
jgi:NADP-dependent 3-hydroxy acid dehydrogenase YdfG